MSKRTLFSERFLSWLIKAEYLEEIMGDLMEYQDELKTKPRWKRGILYWFHVLNFLQPWALKRPTIKPFSNTAMLRHHFKIAFRHLKRQKLYSAINIGGLMAGFTVVILISLLVHNELTFNTYHKNHDHISRVIRSQTHLGQRSSGTNQPFALAYELRSNYSNYFENVAMEVTWTGEQAIAFEDKKFSEQGRYMEPAAPQMLSLKTEMGSINGLKDKSSIMLSSSLSTRLFGQTDPINKVITMNGQRQLLVTGVYEDLPKNSDFFNIHFLVPFELFYDDYKWASPDSWRGSNVAIYVQTRPEVDPYDASTAIENLMFTHVDEETRVNRKPALFLQPMSEWYLYSNFDDQSGSMSAQLKFVLLYALIGLSILLLACINFINLSTAHFERRAKEVAIRKTIGSGRRHLIGQFLGESFLIVQLTFCISIALAWLLLPWFNQVTERAMTLPLNNFWFWVTGISLASFVSLVAGSYPAIYLSSFNPLTGLKGAFSKKRSTFSPRRVLVTFQFTISIILITASVLIYNQIQFAKNRDLGYSQENLLLLSMNSKEYQGKYQLLKTALLATGTVSEVAAAGAPITENQYQNNGFSWKGQQPDFDPIFNNFYISPEFGEVVKWQVLNGRDFSKTINSDISGVIINQSAADILAIDNPIGEELRWTKEEGKTYRILGVVEDLVRNSPFESIRPSVYFLAENQPWVHIRINQEIAISQALPKIEAVFNSIIPTEPFQYRFVDQTYARKFKDVQSISQLSGFFTIVAILICCFGLFGLTSFVAQQRTKEIGIRKILGASVVSLWKMLSQEFVILVLLSFFIAIPLSSLLLNDWLAGFEYRISLNWQVFAIAGIGALVIALATVSYQTLRVSFMNPAESLRDE